MTEIKIGMKISEEELKKAGWKKVAEIGHYERWKKGNECIRWNSKTGKIESKSMEGNL